MRVLILLLVAAVAASAQEQERKVEPTWMARQVSGTAEGRIDVTSDSCRYTPIFGEADAQPKVPVSVARFGELTVAPHGKCIAVEYAREEELYFVLGGTGLLHYGEQSHALAQNDFMYVPPTVKHGVENPGAEPLRVVMVTVRIPAKTQIAAPGKLEVASLSELEEQTVEGHPKSVLYKLLIGPRTTKRDRINAAYNVVDFFLMDFAPGGTNFPHHHEIAEEIYLVLDGEGQMAAGGGMDGIQGLHDAKAGDAYYFRQNCTVGFYNRNEGGSKAHVLAVRVYVPVPKSED